MNILLPDSRVTIALHGIDVLSSLGYAFKILHDRHPSLNIHIVIREHDVNLNKYEAATSNVWGRGDATASALSLLSLNRLADGWQTRDRVLDPDTDYILELLDTTLEKRLMQRQAVETWSEGRNR